MDDAPTGVRERAKVGTARSAVDPPAGAADLGARKAHSVCPTLPSVLGALGALFELSKFRGKVAIDRVAALRVIENGYANFLGSTADSI